MIKTLAAILLKPAEPAAAPVPAPAVPPPPPPPGFPPVLPNGVKVEKLLFTDSPFCRSRVACVECLSGPQFRAAMAKNMKMPDDKLDFKCPHDMTMEKAQEARTLNIAAEAPLPSLFERASNAAKASGRVVKAVIKGITVEVDRPVYLARLTQCFSCPSKQFRASDENCADCGCPVREKAALATEVCKMGYWRPRSVSAFEPDSRVLTANLLIIRKAELLKLLPAEGPTALAIRKVDEDSAKEGCSGCQKRKLQAEAMGAFVKEIPALAPEMRAALRKMFADYDRILDGPTPRPLAEVMGTN